MKFLIRLVLATSILMLAAPVIAGDKSGTGCKVLGSWMGYDESGSAWWMSTADGQNASHGTLNLEVPGSVVFFPGATSVTELRGVWEKTGENTFEWTVIGFPYDATAATVVLARLSGRNIINEGCDSEIVQNVVMEVFLPDADLNSDNPFSVSYFPDHLGYRIKLSSPELP